MEVVDQELAFPKLEERILEYWKKNRIFECSTHAKAPLFPKKTSDKEIRPEYIFYDGPPFATGLPHYGHLLAGTIKDVVGRFFTMKGFRVDRRFGWDCHGVPVEFEIQKSLDLHGAKAIKDYGIGRFNEECRKIVLRYSREWREFVQRSGRWVDFDREYRTMDLDYMESIWWVVKSLWDRGLIYEGVKCVPYSWAINTPLSNFEANLNYKIVQDPALVLRFPLIEDEAFTAFFEKIVPEKIAKLKDISIAFYAWTTTPWTLPSNMALAVGPDLSYALVWDSLAKEIAILARDRVGQYFPDLEERCDSSVEGTVDGSCESVTAIVGEVSGSALVGLQYKPLFNYFEDLRGTASFRVYPGAFVTAEDGTGVVHLASFGEDDLEVFRERGIPIVDPVDEDGNFTEQVPDFFGRNVKEADADIVKLLKANGAVVHHSSVDHSYPFCWRTDTPLIYKSIASWFVRVESIREQLIHLNSTIHWVPEHLRDGRMGKWLEGARDWAISRNRFWGTPLPIWRCSKCGDLQCLGSIEELNQKAGVNVTDLHRHFIDDLAWKCSACEGTMHRVSEVLDCWFESGAMPYAQAHYPFAGKDSFEKNFPADFIAEGLDQTRGWFYTLEVLSTALFGRPAFRNVVVNGIVLAEDGKKMSKSLKNYPPPELVIGEFGADALRLYLLSSAATRGEELRFSKKGVREVVSKYLLPLRNAYNFFVTYGLVDGWSADLIPHSPSPNILDRWILSRVSSLVRGVDNALSTYHLYAATQPMLDFIDQLTNWYIRLNRRRFWSDTILKEDLDKRHAYATLHRVLTTFVRVMAPLAPFITEEIFLNLRKGLQGLDCASVHLTRFPDLDEFEGHGIDQQLEHSMELFEDIIELGRNLRENHGLKVRQPLRTLKIIHSDSKVLDHLVALEGYIQEALNIKKIEYSLGEDAYVDLSAKLNTKELGRILGPRLGSEGMQHLRQAVESLSGEKIRALESGGNITLEGITLGAKDLVIRRVAKQQDLAVASSGRITVCLDTAVSEDLLLEGLAREFVSRVQKLRKEFGFEVADRVLIRFMTAHERLKEAVQVHCSYIMGETLSMELRALTKEQESEIVGLPGVRSDVLEIDGKPVVIGICVAL